MQRQELSRHARGARTPRVRYLVVGGVAVAVHGTPRYTKDLDLWIEASADNAAKLVHAIEAFGLGSLGLTAADFLEPDIVIQLGYEPNRIGLLTGLTGVSFSTAYPRRTYVELDGVKIPVIDRESESNDQGRSGVCGSK